ncbi:Bromodomain containing protein 7 [Tyrophagus putrescentiae]|nr:Bromodomain containing protein 7 [Tyrophagus putrescentiae]
MNSLNLTLLDNSLFSAEKKASDLSTFTSDSNLPTVNNDSTSNMDTTITTATYFSDFDRPFVTTSTSTQQSLELNSLNEFSSKSNWHSTFKNTTLKTMVNSGESTAQNSYFLSSTDNDMLSQKTGSEIKLKLSKTSSSSQYTSNLHHSPGKLTQFTALPPTVPPLIISPLKASSLSVEKSTQITSSEVHQTNLSFQINSKVHNATSDTSNVVLENKLPGTEEPLQKRIKLNNNKHKNVKKKKSEKNFTDLLSYLLRQLTKRDAQQFFAKPVSDLIAPGYSAIIAHPMDLSTIGRNIASGHYHNLGDFKADVKLMCDNAMKYNRAETIYYKAASKLWSYTKNKLFKNASLAEYAKTYVKCTPLDLSLNPSSSQLSNSKYHSTSTHSTSVPFFSIASFNAESAAAAAAATAANNGMPGTSTNLLKSSPARFEPASMPVGFDGIAPMTSTTPFSLLEPEPSSNRPTVESQEKPEPSVSVIEPPKEPPVKKNIVCDGMTAEELVASVKESARKAAERLQQSKRRPPAYSVLRQNSATGIVTLQTLNTGDIAASSKQTFIKNDIFNESMGSFVGNLLTTSDSSNDSKSKHGNIVETEPAKPANQLDAILPILNKQTAFVPETNLSNGVKTVPADSSTSDAHSKKELEIERLRKKLVATYGDEISLDYALSVAKFAKGCEYSENLCNTLMGVLTANEHRNVFEQFYQLVKLTTET